MNAVTTAGRRLYRAAGFVGATAASGAALVVRTGRARGTQAQADARDAVSMAWSQRLLGIFGIALEVHGSPGAPGLGRGRGRVVVANHRSIIDIGVLMSQFGGAFVSRGDLAGWPLIGPAAKNAGTIFVDRGSKRSGADAIGAMVERLALHDTICIFPEGTTYEDDGIRPFKAGAFVAAQRARVPVVPVAIVYPLGSGAAFGGETFLHHLTRLAGAEPTPVLVEIGDPLEPTPGEDVSAFGERCRREVTALLARGRGRRPVSG